MLWYSYTWLAARLEAASSCIIQWITYKCRLRELLEEVLRECIRAGIHIVSIVCEMGTSNVKAMKIMGSTTERPVINFEELKTFDPSHLQKSTRNLFLKYDVRLPLEVIVEGIPITVPGIDKWQDIREAYEWEKKHNEYRGLRKLTLIHIEPKGHSKLKVSIEAPVLSRTVSCHLMTGYSAAKSANFLV